MFEVKCDVKGCSTREALLPPTPMNHGLPLGWRTVSFTDLPAPQPRNPEIERLKKDYAGKHMAQYLEAAQTMLVPPRPMRQHTKHLCPAHALPEFAQVDDDDDTELGDEASLRGW